MSERIGDLDRGIESRKNDPEKGRESTPSKEIGKLEKGVGTLSETLGGDTEEGKKFCNDQLNGKLSSIGAKLENGSLSNPEIKDACGKIEESLGGSIGQGKDGKEKNDENKDGKEEDKDGKEKNDEDPRFDQEISDLLKKDNRFKEFIETDGKLDPEKRDKISELIKLAKELGVDPYDFVSKNKQYLDNPDIMPSNKPVEDGVEPETNHTQDYVNNYCNSGGAVEGTTCASYDQLDKNCEGKTTPDELINNARQYNGTPYKWGGLSKAGIDCSGLVSKALADTGVFKDGFRTIADGFRKGLCTEKNPGEIQKGDLVFYRGESKNGTDTTHVMIATGPAQNGRIPIIDASSGKGCVSERTIPITPKVVAGTPKFYG